MNKISVCIPVYGVEKYIERCARSLFEQTMSDGIEFVFVNDCTKDRSIEILEQVTGEYPQRKNQVKIINRQKNGGLVAARNTALEHAAGDYIIHCDSDDWVDRDLYETMYKEAVASGADLVCAPIVCEYTNGAQGPEIIPKFAKDIPSYIENNLGGNLNHLCTKLYKKEIALDPSLEVPDHISMGEDLLRNIQMLDQCQKIAFVRNSYYHYWQNAASITHNFAEKHFLNLQGIIDILEKKFPGKYENVRQHIKTTLFLAAMRNLHKEKGLLPLFDQVWESTSFKETVKIIFSKKCTLKGRFLLAALCVSKTMTIRFLRYLYRSECR